VKPQTTVRVAVIVIAIAIIIGVAAAIVGSWFVVVTMVLAILGQAVSLRANRQRFGGRRAD
jgi:ABC-type transport system involved in Fe-S cluster assembly fused permease/ATPase subunit